MIPGVPRGKYVSIVLYQHDFEKILPTTALDHGICLADKIIGAFFGVSKRASFTLVSRPDSWGLSSVLAGLDFIVADITARQQLGLNYFPFVQF